MAAADIIRIDREELAQRVAEAFQTAFQKLTDHKADIERLWQEFEQLEPGETIMGCRSKTEFADKVLHRSLRAVQYLLNGRTERREHCSRVGFSPVNADLWDNETPEQRFNQIMKKLAPVSETDGDGALNHVIFERLERQAKSEPESESEKVWMGITMFKLREASQLLTAWANKLEAAHPDCVPPAWKIERDQLAPAESTPVIEGEVVVL